MQRDEIGFAEQLVERRKCESGFPLLIFRLAAWRPVEHPHGKALSAARHRLADQPAAADEPYGFAMND